MRPRKATSRFGELLALCRMPGLLAIAQLTAIAIPTAWAQKASDLPSVFVRTDFGKGQGFAIKNPRGAPSCVVVTAAHVANPGDNIKIIGLDRSGTSPKRFEVAGQVREVFAEAGITILEPRSDLPACAALEIGDVLAAAKSDLVGRSPRVDDVTGEVTYSRIVIEGASTKTIDAASVGARRVEPGFSGGLLSLDDRALGVIQEVDNRGVIKASRLDYSRGFVERYVLPFRNNAPKRPARLAWDATFLPVEYQKAFAAAIDIRRDAETSQRVARQVAQDAMDAQLRARSGSAGHIETADESGVYRGQVNAVGSIVGAGVRTITAGDRLGDEILGRWRAIDRSHTGGKSISEVHGPGVIKREENAYNVSGHRLFEGELGSSATYNGLGVLTMRDGSLWFGRWSGDNLNSPVQIVRGSDGYLFTGTAKDGNLTGPAVLWRNDGQVHIVGFWKDGKLVEDLTEALVRR